MNKQLTPLEALKEILAGDIRCLDLLEEVETALKALEIIKEKQIDIEYIINCDDYEDYYEEYGDPDTILQGLSQEEFDLLKEVLK